MPASDLYAQCEDGIGELFQVASSTSRDQFEQSLMVPKNAIQIKLPNGAIVRRWVPDESPEMEIAQAFKTVMSFEEAVRDENIEKRVRAPLMLLLFFHLLEADLWHTILGNLLNVVIGNRVNPYLFRGQCLRSKVDGIKTRLDECRPRTDLSIDGLYRTICNDDNVDLRNAFSHSQYLLSPNGDVVLTKRFTRKRPPGVIVKGQFSFQEIQDIFRRTLTFLTVFARLRREVLRSLSIAARRR